jgi:septal ring factor EnvC (AmiA/AmiB activator)
MKYVYFLVIPLIVLIGCTSSESKKMDQDIKSMRKTLDSLKAINSSYDKSLDSLNANTKAKEDDLKMIQMQLDSLNKNLKEMEEMK